jgi:hypothetical protein
MYGLAYGNNYVVGNKGQYSGTLHYMDRIAIHLL